MTNLLSQTVNFCVTCLYTFKNFAFLIVLLRNSPLKYMCVIILHKECIVLLLLFLLLYCIALFSFLEEVK